MGKEIIVANNKELFSDPAYSMVRNKGFAKTRILIFKSPKKTKQNINLTFNVIAYQYLSEFYSANIYQELAKVKQTQDDSILGKSYNYVFLDKNCIFRLEAGCVYSLKEWADLKTEFIEAQSSLSANQKRTGIECYCGRGCE